MRFLNRSGMVGVLAASYRCGAITQARFVETLKWLNEQRFVSGMCEWSESFTMLFMMGLGGAHRTLKISRLVG